MSIAADDPNLGALSNGDLIRLLDKAEQEERGLSELRAEIHKLIHAEQARSTVEPRDDAGFAALLQRERELSSRRLQLHQRILDLRFEKSRRIDGIRAPLTIVD